MIVVIIAGGAGTRLWPLSTPKYPKHLLYLNGDKKSLLGNTYRRAKLLSQEVYVVSEASHIHHVREQLPELPEDHLLIEPGRRGTANCLVAVLAKLGSKQDDELITVWPADHYVRDNVGFHHSFYVAGQVSMEHSRIVMVGVEPDHPATGFGYVEKGDLVSDYGFAYKVRSFKEKPDYNTARGYLKSGNYLWSCSYFVGTPKLFKKAMQRHAPSLYQNYKSLAKAGETDYRRIYMKFKSTSIEYGLVENMPGLLVVPASFDWIDLGSFSDLYKALDHDEDGNHLHGRVITEEVENSFIQNHEEKPVAVIGLDNVVVVNSPHGVLVVRKDMSQRVGDVGKQVG